MNAATVFVRTLLKTSAIFIGTTVVFLHPPLDWSPGRTVSAVQSPAEMALNGLIGALDDSDAGVRRQAAASLGTIGDARAIPALRQKLADGEPAVRRAALRAISKIERGIAGR
jgi:hypothetical protein